MYKLDEAEELVSFKITFFLIYVISVLFQVLFSLGIFPRGGIKIHGVWCVVKLH